MEFSKKLDKIEPSATLAITARAKAMKNEGKNVIILAAGEPDFDTPDVIKEAAIKAIKAGFTKYTPESGTLSLKKAICRKLKVDNSLDYTTDEIVVSCGAKHTLYNIFQAILNPDDEVIIIHPFWLSYPEMVRLAGGNPVIIKTDKLDGFKVKPNDIKAAIGERTRALIINSPSNPAGVLYERHELEKIAQICVKNNILIISDEIYEKIIFDNKKYCSTASISPEVKALTIVVNGVSKSFSMTGWRIGYMAGNKKIAEKVSIVQSHSTSNPCSISQAASECALTSDMTDVLRKNALLFQTRRDLLLSLFRGENTLMPLKPDGAFYFFIDISSTGLDSFAFCGKLLEEKGVAIIPGEPFGEDNYVRLSFAAGEEDIKEGVKRIREWVK